MEIIYTDYCCSENIIKIKKELNMDVATRIDKTSWSISDTMSILTLPNLKLAVINTIDELSVIEIGLLHFMCKPILVTTKSIKNYPLIKEKIIDYVNFDSDLRENNNNFVPWYLQYRR